MAIAESSSSDSARAGSTARGSDQTSVFQELVQSQDGQFLRRQKWETRRNESLGPILSPQWIFSTRKRQKDGGQGLSHKERDCLLLRTADEEWISEARKLDRSIIAVREFLQGIRRPYLSMENGIGRRPKPEGIDGAKRTLEAWKGVTSLSEKERDEIEYQVKATIKMCLSRIKELEKGEEIRKRTTPLLSANPFSRLLGSASTSSFPGRSHPLYAEQLSHHRSAITQYLSNQLAQASGRLGDMQEARLRSEQKRRINLAGSAAVAGSNARNGGVDRQTVVAGSISSKNKASSLKNTIPTTLLEDRGTSRTIQSDFSAADLTPEQVQQFEQESNALIKSLSEDLNAVEAAERKLTEISELQTQLIQHLGSQAEVADHLNQEAIGHTLEVGRGNEQLQKAKDNNRQASRFLCMFLIGSGLGLLFLHWMD